STASAVFIIRGDGKELFRSAPLRAGVRESLSVDVSDVKDLELLTEGGGGDSNGSWAIWADPKIRR
ncbi:MAG: glycosyl hydrolase, partial [Verrucomicrobiaceae bacterium]